MINPQAKPQKPRLLVFVISYFAESTLKTVLDRIPKKIFEDYDAEVLIVDDASTDRTFEIGHDYRNENPHLPITVLRNEFNQGYGGNQKVGYTFAIQRGFDFVAMVHGDGQYAPEALPALMEPFRRGEADAVFGSRMLETFGALKGGMPLYKFVGNKVLTRLQNAMLGTKLSEFHSGYRIYSAKTLASLPYRLNSNDFHFDTEIIIQLLNARARIVELPIPTYYGDEICRVNGMKYAKDVLVATLSNTAHRSGLLYQRRYDTSPPDNSHYDLKLGYGSSHTYAIEAVPARAKVLDIGSGPGGIAKELVNKGCDVTVVDQHAPTTKVEPVRVVVQDLDDELAFDIKGYEVLLLLDVIEHLKEPEAFLERMRQQFDHDKRTLIMTTPNIAFLVQRLMLLAGQFNYGKAGILDRTHTRLFTFRGIQALLVDEGFQIKKVRGVPAPFPKVLGEGVLGKAAVKANELLIERVSKTLFSYQIYVEAQTTPGVEFLVHDAIAASAARAEKLDLTRLARAKV